MTQQQWGQPPMPGQQPSIPAQMAPPSPDQWGHQQQLVPAPQQAGQVPYPAMPYAAIHMWRPNPLWATPVVVEVRDGMLATYDRDMKQRYSAPCHALSARVTTMMSLVVEGGPSKLVFLSKGSDISPDPSDRQLAHLSQQRQAFDAAGLAASVGSYLPGGSTLGLVQQAGATVQGVRSWYGTAEHFAELVDAMQRAGARVEVASKAATVRSIVIAIAIALGIVVAILVLVGLLT